MLWSPPLLRPLWVALPHLRPCWPLGPAEIALVLRCWSSSAGPVPAGSGLGWSDRWRKASLPCLILYHQTIVRRYPCEKSSVIYWQQPFLLQRASGTRPPKLGQQLEQTCALCHIVLLHLPFLFLWTLTFVKLNLQKTDASMSDSRALWIVVTAV